MQDFVNGEAVPFRGAQRVGEPRVSLQKIFQISCVAIAVGTKKLFYRKDDRAMRAIYVDGVL